MARTNYATELALVRKDLDHLLNAMEEVKKDVKQSYSPRTEADVLRLQIATLEGRIKSLEVTSVSKASIKLMQILVYGAAGMILTSVMGAILAFVVVKTQ